MRWLPRPRRIRFINVFEHKSVCANTHMIGHMHATKHFRINHQFHVVANDGILMVRMRNDDTA